MLLGIDVSNHQRSVDWGLVKGAGYSFGIVKASEGTGFRDAWMDRNLEEMGRLGIARGVYHYANPDHNDPLEEAEFFISVVHGKLKPGDVIALDLEEGSAPNLSHWALRWLAAVRDEFGVKPLFYSYPHFMANHGLNNNEALATIYPLWYASYRQTEPPAPGIWPKIEIWQNAVEPGVPGVNGDCDRNKYLGGESVEDFMRLGIPGLNHDEANAAFDAYLASNPLQAIWLGEKQYRGDLRGKQHWGGDPLPVLRLERGLLAYSNGEVVQSTGLALDDWQQTADIIRY